MRRSKPDAAQVVAAGFDVGETADGVEGVAFLFDRDEALVANAVEQCADGGVVDDAAADRAHDALGAGFEEADVLT